MKPLRIVLVMIEPPLPFGNAASRWFNVLLKGLVERGHDVTAFATCSKSEEIEATYKLFPAPKYNVRCFSHPVRSGLKSKFNTLLEPYSFMFSLELKVELKKALENGFDILHLEQLWCGWLGQNHISRSLVNVHHLIWIDLEHIRPKTWTHWFERKWMIRAERLLVKKYHFFRSCSPRLGPEMLKFNPSAEITTVPVGLDLTQYEYISDLKRNQAPLVSVIGSMGWYPTQSAAIRFLKVLWPRIKAEMPEAKGQIVGWKAREALKDYLNNPDVNILENVPDIRPYFENTSVLLYAPERGSGMKIKIMEAMAFGVPVVPTSEGTEGLPAKAGVHAFIAEDDDSLVKKTVRLLRDMKLQNQLRENARGLIDSHCSPEVTLNSIEKIYSQILERNSK